MIEIIIFGVIALLALYIVVKFMLLTGTVIRIILQNVAEPVCAWLYYWPITVTANICIYLVYHFAVPQTLEAKFLLIFFECMPAVLAIPSFRNVVKNS